MVLNFRQLRKINSADLVIDFEELDANAIDVVGQIERNENGGDHLKFSTVFKNRKELLAIKKIKINYA